MNAFVALIEINPRSGFSKGVKPLALSKKEKKKKASFSVFNPCLLSFSTAAFGCNRARQILLAGTRDSWCRMLGKGLGVAPFLIYKSSSLGTIGFSGSRGLCGDGLGAHG